MNVPYLNATAYSECAVVLAGIGAYSCVENSGYCLWAGWSAVFAWCGP